MSAIELLAKLASDVTLSSQELTPEQRESIAAVKAEAAQINAIMAIVEPTDPNEPGRQPDDDTPQKDPKFH